MYSKIAPYIKERYIHNNMMYEIVPNLYLSSFHEVQINNKHTFIVNCTKDFPMLHENNIRLIVNDDMSSDAIDGMLKAIPEIIEQIDLHLKNNNEVIVHCLAGQQRSPTIIAAYLMAKHQYTLEDAIAYIRSKKKDAFLRKVNFQESLEKYAMILRET